MCRALFIQNKKFDTIRWIAPISPSQFSFPAHPQLNAHYQYHSDSCRSVVSFFVLVGVPPCETPLLLLRPRQEERGYTCIHTKLSIFGRKNKCHFVQLVLKSHLSDFSRSVVPFSIFVGGALLCFSLRSIYIALRKKCIRAKTNPVNRLLMGY